MSDNDPLLSKMDALMKKHRGEDTAQAPAESARGVPAATPPGWLPVLTQVIERGAPPEPAAPPESELHASRMPAGSAEAVPQTSGEGLADQLMRELVPRLSEVVEKQLAIELRKNLDQTVASLLAQIEVNMREIVCAAVAEKLKQPRDPS
ncbi:MAG: hypothetical protein AB1593_07450 [Pseudomonadota bacterium]